MRSRRRSAERVRPRSASARNSSSAAASPATTTDGGLFTAASRPAGPRARRRRRRARGRRRTPCRPTGQGHAAPGCEGDDPGRVGQGQRARDARRRDLALRVPDDGGRHDAERTPHLGQRDHDGPQRRLHHVDPLQRRRSASTSRRDQPTNGAARRRTRRNARRRPATCPAARCPSRPTANPDPRTRTPPGPPAAGHERHPAPRYQRPRARPADSAARPAPRTTARWSSAERVAQREAHVRGSASTASSARPARAGRSRNAPKAPTGHGGPAGGLRRGLLRVAGPVRGRRARWCRSRRTTTHRHAGRPASGHPGPR